jgi:hypothetical protein
MKSIVVVQMDNKEDKDNIIEFGFRNQIEIYGGEGNTIRFSTINLFDKGDDDFNYLLNILWMWKDDRTKR